MTESDLVCVNGFIPTFAKHNYNVYQIMWFNLHDLVMLSIVYDTKARYSGIYWNHLAQVKFLQDVKT